MAASGQKIEKIIKRYRNRLKEMGIKVNKIILFGSFSKGTAEDGSDIDLIVVSDSFRGMNIRERLEILGVAAAQIFEQIQGLGYTPEELESEEELFLKEVIGSGVEVR